MKLRFWHWIFFPNCSWKVRSCCSQIKFVQHAVIRFCVWPFCNCCNKSPVGKIESDVLRAGVWTSKGVFEFPKLHKNKKVAKETNEAFQIALTNTVMEHCNSKTGKSFETPPIFTIAIQYFRSMHLYRHNFHFSSQITDQTSPKCA